MIRILGVDPGTKVLGYGLVTVDGGRLRHELHGVVRADRGKDFPTRLAQVRDGLARLLEESSPDVMALEEVFFGRNAQSAIRLGEGRGVVLLCAADAGTPVVEYPTALVKRAVTGLGRADKGQVQGMVQRLLGLEAPPRPLDAADALALAICHAHRARFSARVRESRFARVPG